MVSKRMTTVFDRLLRNLMLSAIERTLLITSLLVQNSFDFNLVERALFHLVGVMRPLDSALAQRLTTEQKQMMYKQARAPADAVERDYLEARTKLSSILNIRSAEWKAQSKRVNALSVQLTAARANAAQDIYERVNSEGSGMGERTSSSQWESDERRVDLHGLHKSEAESVLVQFVLPILPVCKSIVLITGKGLHSGGCSGEVDKGKGQLRDSVVAFLRDRKIKCSVLKNNDGAIRVYHNIGC
jgi:DNA-nicking Smr family endonuclease